MKQSDFNFDALIQRNAVFVEDYKSSPLMQLITSKEMESKLVRIKLLDCIQVFSDFFQKSVMLRAIFADKTRFSKIAQEHLEEEFNHNISLMKDRECREPVFDPILEATSCWFAWKMLELDNIGKTFLMHLVLEASAHIFFTEAHKVMSKHGETEYFKIHSEADEYHHHMGLEFFEGLRREEYMELFKIQHQGWSMIFTVCNRIAALTKNQLRQTSSIEKQEINSYC